MSIDCGGWLFFDLDDFGFVALAIPFFNFVRCFGVMLNTESGTVATSTKSGHSSKLGHRSSIERISYC
jgi:hypothetical protein